MFFNDIFNLQRDLDQFLNAQISPTSVYQTNRFPALNLFEKDNCLILKTEVPGIVKSDIKIDLTDNVLSISGEKKTEPVSANYHRQEREAGPFKRQIELPYKVDPEKVKANLENGVLTIELEKREEAKGRQITIS